MVSIVGQDKQYVKQASCRKCASVLEYTLSEVKERKDCDYTGSCDIVKYIDCPKCGHQVVVSGY